MDNIDQETADDFMEELLNETLCEICPLCGTYEHHQEDGVCNSCGIFLTNGKYTRLQLFVLYELLFKSWKESAWMRIHNQGQILKQRLQERGYTAEQFEKYAKRRVGLYIHEYYRPGNR